LELFFTRAETPFGLLVNAPKIYEARRRRADLPFGPPTQIGAISGFAEAPTISPDSLTLYYHTLIDGQFKLYRVVRGARPAL